MTETSANSLSATEDAWAELARIYRSICLLRSRGRETDAERMQARELAGAIAALKQAAGNDFAVDERANLLFTRERDRVADAEALVEILAPALADRLGTLHPSAVTTPPAVATTATAAAHTPTVETPSPTRVLPRVGPTALPTAPPSSGPPGIADLLDDMLAQERGARPMRPARRTS